MKRIYTFILLLFLCNFSFAQFSGVNDYVARTWNTTDGLPGNTISDLLQSSDGYMYFATYEGLVKFDGFEKFVGAVVLKTFETFAFIV